MVSVHFNQLSLNQKAQLLFLQGFYLHTRSEPGIVVDLYQMQGLYVEVYFSKATEEFLTMKSFYSDESNIEKAHDSDAPLLPLSANNTYTYYSC
ncbi:MAG TPA: hypothetical protein VM935_12660 [Chitinophagaceae bacterium]|jgi:hypothetical protein|nr:hypothetical protein [Chitinophagaceae bacterium]